MAGGSPRRGERAKFSARARRLFGPLDDAGGLVLAGEAAELLDAGRARDVDLGEVLADDVEADEDEAVGLEARADGADELALARREVGRDDAAADVDVRADLVAARDTQDRAERLAVEQEDALVALGHGREELLHHREPLS